MKLFGKELFSFKKPLEPMYNFMEYEEFSTTANLLPFINMGENSPRDKKKEEKSLITPKALFQMKALHQQNFQINVDPSYIDEEVALIEDKLKLFGKKISNDKAPIEVGGRRYSRLQLESMKERLLNRKKIASVQDILEKYPHTTTERIITVTKQHKNVVFEQATIYLPDFPRQAVSAMKEYNAMCEKLCGKTSVFYVLVEKKIEQQAKRSRDPILFAQSPFGFFWNIQGAWDKEIRFLTEL